MFELAWYHSCPEKTVIGIYDTNEDDLHCNHPFVKQSVTTWVQNHWQAIDLITEYFKL